MRKSIKFLAISLASVSVMSLTTPAFAESASENNETAAITAEEGSTSSEENAASADSTKSAVTDTDSSDGAQAADPENDTNQNADPEVCNPESTESESGNKGTGDAESSKETADETKDSAKEVEDTVCTPYINENHEKVYTGKYATAYVTHDGYSGYINITDTSIWDTADGLTEIGGYPLSDIINFQYSGTVSNIKIATDGGMIYDNRIFVTGAADYRWMGNMFFTDETDDQYGLTLYSSSMKTHTVDYNSAQPKLKKITWCTQNSISKQTMSYDVDTTKDWAIPAKGTFYQMEDGWKIYKDEYATAIVPPRPTVTGEDAYTVTGRIFITDQDFWKKYEALTQINGIALSEITGTGNGYMSSVKTVHDGGLFYDNTLTVKASHAGGVFSQEGGVFASVPDCYEVDCIDKTKDYYHLDIWAEEEKEHTVWYNSDSPEIMEIDWKIYPVSHR